MGRKGIAGCATAAFEGSSNGYIDHFIEAFLTQYETRTIRRANNAICFLTRSLPELTITQYLDMHEVDCLPVQTKFKVQTRKH